MMTECVILGGGISGLLCARELAISGWRVSVLERAEIGREASWAGGGILSPLYPWRQPEPIERLSRWSQQYYPALSESLARASGIDPQWQRCGMLWLNLEDFDAAAQWCRGLRIDWDSPDSNEIEKIQPGLRRMVGGHPLWVPGIAQIRNPRMLKALKQDLRQRGVALKDKTPVTGFRFSGGRVVAVQTPGEEIRSDVFVVTAGAWSSQWLMDDLWQPKIRPVKGQMLLINARPKLLSTMVQQGQHYLIPRLDGRILSGSTVEEAGFDKRPTETAYQSLYRFAVETLPALKAFPVALQWAGLRPAAPDGIPYIGRHPQLANLYYNCGHFRNGVIMGPAASRLLADLVLDRTPILDPAAFSPENRL
ncbi:MAG: glycine oxidase ThiO [Methylohalobius sp. ZOD2]